MSIWKDCEQDATSHGVNNDEWRTRDGRVMKVKDMTTQHIKNCMRMLGGPVGDFYYVFKAELARRGEKLEER